MIGSAIQVLINWLGVLFSRTFFDALQKMALAMAFIAIFTASIYLYIRGFSSVVTALDQTVPQIVSGVWEWVMPPNVKSCVFYLFTACMLKLCVYAFFRILNFKYIAAISAK